MVILKLWFEAAIPICQKNINPSFIWYLATCLHNVLLLQPISMIKFINPQWYTKQYKDQFLKIHEVKIQDGSYDLYSINVSKTMKPSKFHILFFQAFSYQMKGLKARLFNFLCDYLCTPYCAKLLVFYIFWSNIWQPFFIMNHNLVLHPVDL